MASPLLAAALGPLLMLPAAAAAESLPLGLEPLDDATVLLQHSAVNTRGRSLTRTRPELTRGLSGVVGARPSWLKSLEGAFYCASFPALCQPPFNCHKHDADKADVLWKAEGISPDGKPNYQTWCGAPQFMPMMARCAAGNLVEAGKVQFDLTSLGIMGEFTAELDASYCFLEGHCTNDAVTNETTAEEAIKMCDERFGHEAWTKFGADSSPPEDHVGFDMDLIENASNGFTSSTQTRPYLLAACAMGNYHCDVIYCKESYCKNSYYVDKYGHLLKDYGWTK